MDGLEAADDAGINRLGTGCGIFGKKHKGCVTELEVRLKLSGAVVSKEKSL